MHFVEEYLDRMKLEGAEAIILLYRDDHLAFFYK